MGTRGFIGFYYEGIYYIMYVHYDAHDLPFDFDEIIKVDPRDLLEMFKKIRINPEGIEKQRELHSEASGSFLKILQKEYIFCWVGKDIANYGSGWEAGVVLNLDNMTLICFGDDDNKGIRFGYRTYYDLVKHDYVDSTSVEKMFSYFADLPKEYISKLDKLSVERDNEMPVHLWFDKWTNLMNEIETFKNNYVTVEEYS